jgi:hypothetical protein
MTDRELPQRTWRARPWTGIVAAALALVIVLAVGVAGLAYPSEGIVYYGGMGLAGLMAVAALVALTPGLPYRLFAAGFFVASLSSVWLLTPPRLIDEAPGRWLAERFGYEEPERPFLAWNSVQRDIYYTHRRTGDLVAALWLGFAAGIATQTSARVASARWKLAARPRRWHQFTLRTLVAYTTAVAILCGVVLQQREAGRAENTLVAKLEFCKIDKSVALRYSLFPWLLPLLEQGPKELSLLNVKHGRHTYLSSSDWEKLEGCRSLSCLVITCPGWHDEPVRIGEVARPPNLEVLVLDLPSFDDSHARHFAPLRHLQWLEVTAKKISLEELPVYPKLTLVLVCGELEGSLTGLARQPNLRKLVIEGSTLSAEHVDQIATLKGTEEVELKRVILEPAALTRLPSVAALKVLRFRHFEPIDDSHLESIGQCRRLEELDLFGKNISDAGLAHLEGHAHLQTLYLMGTQVSDDGMPVLAGLPQLTWLKLGDTKVTDAGVAHLAESKSLEFLFLQGTPVTDACLAHLAKMESLREVILYGCQVTPEGIKSFQAQRPEVSVVSRSPLRGLLEGIKEIP